MREEIGYFTVGRGYRVQLIQVSKTKYEVELAHGGRYICSLSTGCIGLQSGNYWLNHWNKMMQRLMFLCDGIDMANHNKMCYSTNLLMDTPKPEYAEQWHTEHNKAEMLYQWCTEFSGIKPELNQEFNEYIRQ